MADNKPRQSHLSTTRTRRALVGKKPRPIPKCNPFLCTRVVPGTVPRIPESNCKNTSGTAGKIIAGPSSSIKLLSVTHHLLDDSDSDLESHGTSKEHIKAEFSISNVIDRKHVQNLPGQSSSSEYASANEYRETSNFKKTKLFRGNRMEGTKPSWNVNKNRKYKPPIKKVPSLGLFDDPVLKSTLVALNLEGLYQLFKINGIKYADYLRMKEMDFIKIGINDQGVRKILLKDLETTNHVIGTKAVQVFDSNIKGEIKDIKETIPESQPETLKLDPVPLKPTLEPPIKDSPIIQENKETQNEKPQDNVSDQKIDNQKTRNKKAVIKKDPIPTGGTQWKHNIQFPNRDHAVGAALALGLGGTILLTFRIFKN